MSKNIILSPMKNSKEIRMVIGNEKENRPVTVRDAIEGFLLFIDNSFRTNLTSGDLKIMYKLNKRIIDSENKETISLDDNEIDWLKKKLCDEIPEKIVVNSVPVDNKNSYGGLAFGVDLFTVLDALDNIEK